MTLNILKTPGELPRLRQYSYEKNWALAKEHPWSFSTLKMVQWKPSSDNHLTYYEDHTKGAAALGLDNEDKELQSELDTHFACYTLKELEQDLESAEEPLDLLPATNRLYLFCKLNPQQASDEVVAQFEKPLVHPHTLVRWSTLRSILGTTSPKVIDLITQHQEKLVEIGLNPESILQAFKAQLG